MGQRYCRKVTDPTVYGYTDALMARPDFVECDAEGRRMDVKPPEAEGTVAGIAPEVEEPSPDMTDVMLELKEMSKEQIQEWANEHLGGLELDLRQEHAKVVEAALDAWEKLQSDNDPGIPPEAA